MSHSHTPRPLAGPLRARINRLAHAQAQQHETRLKAALLNHVQSARDGGATFVELAALVAKLEAAPPEPFFTEHPQKKSRVLRQITSGGQRGCMT